MRKTILALVVSSLTVSGYSVSAQELLADASTNFEPARKAGSQPAEPAQSPPTTSATPARTVEPTGARPAPARTAVTSTVSPEVAHTAQDEILKRQERQIAGRALLDEGQKLYYDGKYEQAIAKLEQAVKVIPHAKATEVDYNRALHALTDSYCRLADTAYRAGDNKKARDYAQRALEYDSRNRTAENLLVQIKRMEAAPKTPSAAVTKPGPTPSPARAPEFLAKRDEIRRLFRDGRILLNSGQYDEAEKRFQQVLLLDPYNTDAYDFLNEVTRQRQPSTAQGTDASRNAMMWKADNTWVAPISGEVKLPQTSAEAGPLAGKGAASVAIQRKLSEIIFPEIKFREATIIDVVSYLSEESRKLDKPSGEGINIVLGTGVATGEPAPATGATSAPAGEGAQPPPAATPAAASTVSGVRPITLALRNVPMIEALKYITSLANLKYRIESSAVLILPADAAEGAMITRTYPVTPGAFSKIVAAPTTAASTGGEFVRMGAGGAATAGTLDVKALFTEAGVPFPAGSSIVYNDRTSTLIVRNTPDNIESLERILPAFVDIPKQVQIEAKFVEISQSDLDELGFQWQVGKYQIGQVTANGGTPPTVFPTSTPNPNSSYNISGGLRDATGLQGNTIEALLGAAATSGSGGSLATVQSILTDPQFQVVIQALAQKKSADVLSAPKVTTISGMTATMKVVQEFIYPNDYSQPQVGQSGITPSVPSGWKTREVGVVLTVTPTVGADGYTINLTLIPEVSTFLGFLDYSPGNVTASSTNGQNIITNYKIVQPLFASRNLTTSVVLWDGQTVVLGGLITEDIQKIDDKVPFLGDIPVLGRLFRSKVSQRSKRNLLVFVTARLIDPAGNPIHRESLIRVSTR